MSHNSHLLAAGTGSEVVPNPALPLCLEVSSVDAPKSRDEKLGRAVDKLIPAALERRQGILVIQRDYGTYTVRVDPQVPCGTIWESRC